MRAFDDVWNELQYTTDNCRKRPTIIYTLDKESGNRIVEVTNSYIRRDSETRRSGASDKITKKAVNKAWDVLVAQCEVTASKVDVLYFTFVLMVRLLKV